MKWSWAAVKGLNRHSLWWGLTYAAGHACPHWCSCYGPTARPSQLVDCAGSHPGPSSV